MILLLLLLQVTPNAVSVDRTSESKLRLVNKLSDASLPSSLFGNDWKHSEGIVVNDFNDLRDVSPVHLEVFKEMKLEGKMRPFGVAGVADYSVARIKPPADAVTVRILLFTDVKMCDQWWKRKYQSEGWQKLYKVVNDGRFDAAIETIDIEYPSVNKRILKLEAAIVEAFHLGKGEQHLKAAEHIIKQLTTNKKQTKVGK